MQLHVGLLDSRAINHCKGCTEVSSPDDSSWTIRTRTIHPFIVKKGIAL